MAGHIRRGPRSALRQFLVLLLAAALGLAAGEPEPAAADGCVVTVAGDIAAGLPGSSRSVNATKTGDLVRAVAPTYALTTGDNAYPNGTIADYQEKYDPTWGSFKEITRPTPGNHDYVEPDAVGYFTYFFNGVRAGNEYYAFDCGSWRLYALNCEIPCGEGSEQLAWLQSDVAAHPGGHYLAYLHRPRFTSGTKHAPDPGVSPIYRALQAAGGDIILAGHNHQYERFARQDADGNRDLRGLRQFVVGTGGKSLYGFGLGLPNAEYRNAQQFGVLKLTLTAAAYSWQFLASGRMWTGTASADDPDHPFGTVLDNGSEATNNSSTGNRPPVVNAGADQQIVLNATATLAGTVTDDGLPNPPRSTMTTWFQLSGPATVTFADPSSPSTNASFPHAGSYLLRLMASDGELTAADDVAIQVTAADNPVVCETGLAAPSDDAEERSSGRVVLTSSDLELVVDGTRQQTVGLRQPPGLGQRQRDGLRGDRYRSADREGLRRWGATQAARGVHPPLGNPLAR